MHSGKDTAVDYIYHTSLMNGVEYKKMSFAGPLKKMVGEMFGFSEEQLYGDKKDEVENYP